MKRAAIVFLVLVLLSLACEETPPPPSTGILNLGWEDVCDGFTYTGRQGKEFVCANSYALRSFRFPKKLYITFYSDLGGEGVLEEWYYTPDNPITVINASGGIYTYPPNSEE